MRINALLIILAIIISFVFAPCFGNWYGMLDSQNGDWFISIGEAETFAGFILAYTFFVSLLLNILSSDNKRLTIWFVCPVLLLYISYNWKLLFVPLVLISLGFLLARLIRRAIPKRQLFKFLR
jgi:hypothetical protein